MQSLFELVVFFVVAIFAGSLLFAKIGEGRRGSGVPRVARRALMTQREIAFWHRLRQAADPLYVAPQVAMNALLNAERGLDKQQWGRTRNQFQNKVVDYALVDDDGTVRLLVELDDRTHIAEKDDKRDRMTARAGYFTLRVNGAPARDADLLRQAVQDALEAQMP